MKKVLAILFSIVLVLALFSVVPFVAIAETVEDTEAVAVSIFSGINLTPFFQLIIAILGALITRWIIPWIKQKTTASQQASLTAMCKTLVYAAEQIYGAGTGAEKLNYVKQKLLSLGFMVDTAAIEAAVKEMNLTGAWGLAGLPETTNDK